MPGSDVHNPPLDRASTTMPPTALIAIIVGALAVAVARYVSWTSFGEGVDEEGSYFLLNEFGPDDVAITVLCVALIGLCLIDTRSPQIRAVRIATALGGAAMVGLAVAAAAAVVLVEQVALGPAMTAAGGLVAALGTGVPGRRSTPNDFSC